MERWLSWHAPHISPGRDELADDAARKPDNRQPLLRLLPRPRPQTATPEPPRAQTIRLRCLPCGDQCSAPVRQTSVYMCDSTNRTRRRLIVLTRFQSAGPHGSPDHDPPSGPACGQCVCERERWQYDEIPRRHVA